VDFREVEAAFKALEGRERELSQALAAPHLLPKTREELERALEEVREERRRLVALLESLAAERALAKGEPGGRQKAGGPPGRPPGSVGQPTGRQAVNSVP